MPTILASGSNINIAVLPHVCPFCHKSITPNLITGHKFGSDLEVFMTCPDLMCKKSFIGYYFNSNSTFTFTGRVSQGTLISKIFTETITEISEMFSLIYNQAFVAEQQNLTEICGVGYRKALEYLIKDYSILNHETEKDKIEKMLLGKVIDTYVNDERVKSVAKRAAWLGNDETHYVRRWEGKNLADLKKLIDLTIHWIEMETLSASFVEDMPD